jgi:hypothetical protein
MPAASLLPTRELIPGSFRIILDTATFSTLSGTPLTTPRGSRSCGGNNGANSQKPLYFPVVFELGGFTIDMMTKLLEQALEAARSLPPNVQDDIARVVLRLTGTDDEPPVTLSPEERTAIATSQEAAARGEFATDEQVRAVWSKHGL